MRRVLLLLLAITLALGLQKVPVLAESINLNLSTPDPLTSEITLAAQHFAEVVERKSGGEVRITVYPDGVLFGGSAPAAVKMLGSGVLDMLTLSSSLYASFEPKFNAISVPFMFRDEDQFAEYLNSPLGQELLAGLGRLDIQGLGFWLRPFRQITNSKRSLVEMEDFRGLRMRVPSNPIYVEFFKALGTDPTPLDFGELYNALQLGTVDGQENPLSIPLSARFYEVQSYLTISNHIADAWVVGVSRSRWDSLSPSVRSILLEAVAETAQWKREADAATEREYLERLEQEGMIVNVLDPEVLQQMAEVSQSLTETFSELVGTDFYNRTVEFVKQ